MGRRTLAAACAAALLALAACSSSSDSGSADPTDQPTTSVSGRAAPPTRQDRDEPTAVVAMGDSFISGQAGRWLGNSPAPAGDHAGTDRAWVPELDRADPAVVYGDTARGCFRADVADVISSDLGPDQGVDELVNLACAGARTSNLRRSSEGGTGQSGEPSQADALAEVAADHHVEMVVVSIGGNDLGYGDVLTRCGIAFATGGSGGGAPAPGCAVQAQAEVDQAMPTAMAGVAKALEEIRAVLDDAGQSPDTYRLVLRTYPSPVPSGDEYRYPATGSDRLRVGACPFGDADSTWARGSLVPEIAAALAAVAAADPFGVELLDVQDSLDGRELCSRQSSQVDPGSEPDGATAEWVRWVDLLAGQGDAGESLHPNAFAQMAAGRCIALLYAATPGDHACTNTPAAGPEAMVLTPL